MEAVILVSNYKRKRAIVPNFIVSPRPYRPPTLKLASLSVIQYAVFYMKKVIELPMEIITMIVERTTVGWSLGQLMQYTPPTLK